MGEFLNSNWFPISTIFSQCNVFQFLKLEENDLCAETWKIISPFRILSIKPWGTSTWVELVFILFFFFLCGLHWLNKLYHMQLLSFNALLKQLLNWDTREKEPSIWNLHRKCPQNTINYAFPWCLRLIILYLPHKNGMESKETCSRHREISND